MGVNNEGDILKGWVKSKGYEAQEIAAMLNLKSRQAIYEIYKAKVLSNKHKEALSKFGFDVDNVKNVSSKRESEETYDSIPALKKEITMLNRELETANRLITVLERESELHLKLINSNLFTKAKSVPQPVKK
jgi:uncharacterized protein YabN with tetrapyrrole methylase and pyrophosphatase domain